MCCKTGPVKMGNQNQFLRIIIAPFLGIFFAMSSPNLHASTPAGHDRALKRKVELMSEFILAAVIVKPGERRSSLLKTQLPQKIKRLLNPTKSVNTFLYGELF